MPHHPALLQLSTPLGFRAQRRRCPRVPLRKRSRGALGVLLPASAQRRQGQVLGQPPAAIPDHPISPLTRTRKPDRVADHPLGAAGRVPRADLQPLLAQRPDELALLAAGGRARAHDPLQRLAAAALRMLPAIAVMTQPPRVGPLLAGLDPAAARAPLARLQLPQPMPALKLAARFLGAWAVVVHRRFAAVLGHQRHHHMRVIRPAGRPAVADRHPPALGLGPLASEPHLRDELLADPRPPLIRKVRLLRMKRQRAVPHVRVARPDHPPVAIARRTSPRCRTDPAAHPRTAPAPPRHRAPTAAPPPSGPPPANPPRGEVPRAPRACPCQPDTPAPRGCARRG